jgi:hypothetical protein
MASASFCKENHTTDRFSWTKSQNNPVVAQLEVHHGGLLEKQ